MVYATTEPHEALIMGGEVIVMHEGRVLQTGPTAEVYRRPASTTVGAVFSDPPMNLIDVEVADGRAMAGSGLGMALASHLAGLRPGGYRLGFRANHVSMRQRSAADLPVESEVELAEVSGSETFIHVRHGELAWVGAGGGRAPACAGREGHRLARPGAALRLRPRRRPRRRPGRGLKGPSAWHGSPSKPLPTATGPPRPRRADYALKPMSFAFEKGGAYALLGPSGCGKTTLLNIVSGLLRPSEGRVLFDGRDVTGSSPGERNIAQVFQFPVIYDTMTVGQNLAFPLRNRGLPAAQIERRVGQVAAMLELAPLLGRRAAGLSADQKQKISVGRGLVRDDVAAILFDEPLTVIDPHLKWQLRRKLKEVHKEFSHTLVYVTHDQNEALTFAAGGRGHVRGRDRPGGHAAGAVRAAGAPLRRLLHRLAGHELPARPRRRGRRAARGHRVRLAGDWRPNGAGPNGRLALGIRPEHLAVRGMDACEGIPGAVERVADLGNYQLVTGRIGPHLVQAKLPEGAPVPAERAKFVFRRRWLRLYADDRLAG